MPPQYFNGRERGVLTKRNEEKLKKVIIRLKGERFSATEGRKMANGEGQEKQG